MITFLSILLFTGRVHVFYDQIHKYIALQHSWQKSCLQIYHLLPQSPSSHCSCDNQWFANTMKQGRTHELFHLLSFQELYINITSLWTEKNTRYQSTTCMGKFFFFDGYFKCEHLCALPLILEVKSVLLCVPFQIPQERSLWSQPAVWRLHCSWLRWHCQCGRPCVCHKATVTCFLILLSHYFANVLNVHCYDQNIYLNLFQICTGAEQEMCGHFLRSKTVIIIAKMRSVKWQIGTSMISWFLPKCSVHEHGCKNDCVYDWHHLSV